MWISRFACSGWLAHTPPVAEGVVSARLSALQARTTAILRELLEASAAGQTLPGLLAGGLYQSCMSPSVQAQAPIAIQAELARLRDASSLLALDVRAPHPVLVNAPLRNLAAFSEAFACRPGAPMVASPRCEVW